MYVFTFRLIYTVPLTDPGEVLISKWIISKCKFEYYEGGGGIPPSQLRMPSTPLLWLQHFYPSPKIGKGEERRDPDGMNHNN